MASVTLDRVCKTYRSERGEVEAVKDVTLDIADKEFVVLVGPSGCGKSTTLRMVAGLEDISSGTIRIGDRVVNQVAPKDRDIAMVFQNYALYPHMSVFKNMSFGLKMRKFPAAEIKQRVNDAATLLGISNLLDRKPKQLSGGERQRVAVGRAIVRDPKVFLFDEPLSNLDAQLRVQMRSELKKLHRRLRTTIIYVTHDQEEAMTLGDRIVVMKDGHVQQSGRPLDVYLHPINRFVARFVGTPPMNLFDGQLVEGPDGLAFQTSGRGIRLPEALAKKAASFSGQPMVLGARPESLTIAALAKGADSTAQDRLAMKVQLVELLGESADVYLQADNQQPVVARVSSRLDVTEGETVDVVLDPSRLHLFEREGMGRNVGLEHAGVSSGAN
jgi:multiple sugar transport system ATP-binding protein